VDRILTNRNQEYLGKKEGKKELKDRKKRKRRLEKAHKKKIQKKRGEKINPQKESEKHNGKKLAHTLGSEFPVQAILTHNKHLKSSSMPPKLDPFLGNSP